MFTIVHSGAKCNVLRVFFSLPLFVPVLYGFTRICLNDKWIKLNEVDRTIFISCNSFLSSIEFSYRVFPQHHAELVLSGFTYHILFTAWKFKR